MFYFATFQVGNEYIKCPLSLLDILNSNVIFVSTYRLVFFLCAVILCLLTGQRVPGLPLPLPCLCLQLTPPPSVCHSSAAPFSSLSECCAAFSSFRFLSVRFSHTFCSLVDNEQLQHYDSASRSSFRGGAVPSSSPPRWSISSLHLASFSPLAIQTQAFLLKFHVRPINFPALCTHSIRLASTRLVLVFMHLLALLFFRF